jgi:hypothetical protein
VTPVSDEDIRWFDIAMDDSFFVGGFVSIGRLDGKSRSSSIGNGACTDFLTQRVPSSSSITITGW